jgi:hypothetical protein
MSNKTGRAMQGPSWIEVILGAVLSLGLGAVLGLALLVLRPATAVKEAPKEPQKNVVYYIEGSKDASKARQALEKRKAFVAGQSVSVGEEEINTLIAPVAPPAGQPGKGKDGKEAKDAKAAPPADGTFAVGTPNVRIRDGRVQVGVPVTVSLIDLQLLAVARGGLANEGGTFVFQPDELYLGSLPLHRLPVLPGLVRGLMAESYPIPEDIRTAWGKLKEATVAGNAVKLTMP